MKTASGWILAPVLFAGGACIVALAATFVDRPEGLSADSERAGAATNESPIVADTPREAMARMDVRPGDWPQRGGWPSRNNIPDAANIPATWDARRGTNVQWSAELGSQSYPDPVVANGRVFIGTNNGAGYVKRFPEDVDLGVLLCFEEATGKFLWQHSNQKLPAGREHDWPHTGVCSSPCVDGDRLWYVSNRCEVVCLDPTRVRENEPHVVWKFDMIGRLGVWPHNMATCSVTCAGDILLVCTSNGVDESHDHIPAPRAPSFIALDRRTGEHLWSDGSPGANILHGQWSSPAYGIFDGQPQAIFPGGDGWLYSFDPRGDGRGKSKLLWTFDLNPKESAYVLGGRGSRNEFGMTPAIHEGRVYVAVGQDAEHGEGQGGLWCIDPTKRGDVSPQLAFDAQGNPLPPRRRQAVDRARGEITKPNPNSAAVWHFASFDRNGDGRIDFEETMHRSISTPVIRDDLLYVPDFSGVFHCLNAETGIPHWSHDLFASVWGSPLIADGKVYVGDEDGDIAVFAHSREKRLLAENNMGNATYGAPIVANGVLYIATKSRLFAIAEK